MYIAINIVLNYEVSILFNAISFIVNVFTDIPYVINSLSSELVKSLTMQNGINFNYRT